MLNSNIIALHKEWLPKVSRKPAPGSAARILTYDANGRTIWENTEIKPGAPIPEL